MAALVVDVLGNAAPEDAAVLTIGPHLRKTQSEDERAGLAEVPSKDSRSPSGFHSPISPSADRSYR